MRTAMAGSSAGRRRRHTALVGLGLVMVLVASACGTRANRSQIDEALGQSSRAGGTLAAGPGSQDASNALSPTGASGQDAANATGPLSATVASSSTGTASNPN